MKNFFLEFKKFVTRGNIVDMAVGVIVGSSFTAVVNGLSNFILKPIINAIIFLIMGKGGLENVYTPLVKNYMLNDAGEYILNEAGEKILDLANSIYIDWGAFISAIINFLIIAFVLFSIVKILNSLNDAREKAEAAADIYSNEKKEIRKIRKQLKVTKEEAKAILEQRRAEAAAKAAEEKRIADEKAATEAKLAEEKAMANTLLLTEIRDLLKNK